MSNPVSKRVRPGLYRVTYESRTFEVRSMEEHSEGMSDEKAWLLFEMDDEAQFGETWWSTLPTKADCMVSLKETVDREVEDAIERKRAERVLEIREMLPKLGFDDLDEVEVWKIRDALASALRRKEG